MGLSTCRKPSLRAMSGWAKLKSNRHASAGYVVLALYLAGEQMTFWWSGNPHWPQGVNGLALDGKCPAGGTLDVAQCPRWVWCHIWLAVLCDPGSATADPCSRRNLYVRTPNCMTAGIQNSLERFYIWCQPHTMISSVPALYGFGVLRVRVSEVRARQQAAPDKQFFSRPCMVGAPTAPSA